MLLRLIAALGDRRAALGCLTACSDTAVTPDLVIETREGPVLGKAEDGVKHWLGLPLRPHLLANFASKHLSPLNPGASCSRRLSIARRACKKAAF